MRKKVIFMALIVVLGLAGCGKAADTSGSSDSSNNSKETSKEPFQGDYVVTPDYVKEHLDSAVLVDARGEEAAAKETVKGAVATTWQALATCEDGKSGDKNWGCILEPKRLSERLSKLGLSKDKEIILFAVGGQGGWGEDGRILWELAAAGYEQVKMVDGGFEALKAAGVEMQKGASKPDACDVTIDAIDETHVINTDELKKVYDTVKVVDVREDAEYKGATKYGEEKGGHLPGAIHVRFTDLFNSDGTLKPNAEIIALFEKAGLKPEDQIVTYCTGGIRSAYMQLVMQMCGYEQVKNYDESYYRWCAVEEVEK